MAGQGGTITVDDERYMELALRQAVRAAEKGDVPIGAVLVLEGEVLAEDHNRREERNDPTAHAEILVLQQAARIVNSWRLIDTVLYVTLEPCPMCAGALVQARVKRLVYGAADPKAGAVDSMFGIPGDPRLNHRVEVTRGVLEKECAVLLQDFFRSRR